jgi:peptidoglycan/xylan/chitin deacetylase (PgdA/CDA1 family)
MKVPILAYHDIGKREIGQPHLSVDLECEPEIFISHLDRIEREKFTTATFFNFKSNFGIWLVKPIILTFDDGTNSQWFAFEELKKRRMKGVFFVTPGLFGKPEYLSEQQVKLMFEGGMEIGSHTMTHAMLTRITLDQAWYEINESKKYLDDLLKTDIISFCYPWGEYNNEIMLLVDKAGYNYARTATFDTIATINERKNFEVEALNIKRSNKDFGGL